MHLLYSGDPNTRHSKYSKSGSPLYSVPTSKIKLTFQRLFYILFFVVQGPLEALLFLSKSPSLATSRVTSTDPAASGVITCYYCLREFPTRWNLTRHMENAAHSGEKPFCCLVCNERFGQKADLKAHLQLSHNLAL